MKEVVLKTPELTELVWTGCYMDYPAATGVKFLCPTPHLEITTFLASSQAAQVREGEEPSEVDFEAWCTFVLIISLRTYGCNAEEILLIYIAGSWYREMLMGLIVGSECHSLRHLESLVPVVKDTKPDYGSTWRWISELSKCCPDLEAWNVSLPPFDELQEDVQQQSNLVRFIYFVFCRDELTIPTDGTNGAGSS